VLIVKDGVVTRKQITVGAPGPDGIPVKEGLTAQDEVIVTTTGLTVGQKVATKPQATAKG
jgi:hypothetical protein